MSSTKSAPTSVTLCHALISLCDELGLPEPLREETQTGLPENKGWAFLRFKEGAAALIIQKTSGKPPQVHSHLDLEGHDGFIPLRKENGRVLCHFEPDLEKLRAVLPLFVEGMKRAVAVPTKRQATASQAVPPPARRAASPTPPGVPSYTEEEFEEEARMYQTVNQA